MDPNETLRMLRSTINERRLAADAEDTDAEIDLGHDIAELAESLDAWLSTGGFLPRDWRQS